MIHGCSHAGRQFYTNDPIIFRATDASLTGVVST